MRLLPLALLFVVSACAATPAPYALSDDMLTPNLARAADVSRVEGLVLDRAEGGGVGVNALGRMDGSGAWIARLVETGRADGVLTYRFVVAPPRAEPPDAITRRDVVTGGTFLTPRQLVGVTRVRVEGALNAVERAL